MTALMPPTPLHDDPAGDVAVRPRVTYSKGDRAFRGIATAAASVCLVLVTLTLLYLANEARPALKTSGYIGFFTSSVWNPSVGKFGVFGLLVGTIIIATIALLVAVPIAIGMALFINEYAPGRVRTVLTSVIDLLAALPSLLFGMWGFFTFKNQLLPVSRWFAEHMSVIPFFQLDRTDASLNQSSFIIGMVVTFMIVPIITSVAREVMARAPREQCEGALALGGTRWGMARTVILPFGRSGIVGAVLLGFGRALGETIAVALLINLVFEANLHVLETGSGSIAALIAIKFGEAGTLERSGLAAAGLALFLLTLAVNLAAQRIVNKVRTS